MTKDLTILGSGRQVTPEYLEAVRILQEGKVPPSAIKTHPGKGGQQFTYYSHVWGTKQLRNGLGLMWSFDVLDYQVWPDGSATARVKLSLHMPIEGNGFFTNSITEVGAFEGNPKMSHANKVAGAVSRGLCRCMMRRFGLGAEFYESEQAISPKAAWNSLKAFAANHGVGEDTVVPALKRAGVTKDNLVSRFETAYRVVSELAGTARAEEEVPEGLGEDKEPSPDPVVEAAKDLGGEVVEEPPDEIHQEVPHQAPKEKLDWVKFYAWAKQQWDEKFGEFTPTLAKGILQDVFGGDIRRVNKKDLAAGFTAWMKADSNEQRQAIRDKFSG